MMAGPPVTERFSMFRRGGGNREDGTFPHESTRISLIRKAGVNFRCLGWRVSNFRWTHYE